MSNQKSEQLQVDQNTDVEQETLKPQSLTDVQTEVTRARVPSLQTICKDDVQKTSKTEKVDSTNVQTSTQAITGVLVEVEDGQTSVTNLHVEQKVDDVQTSVQKITTIKENADVVKEVNDEEISLTTLKSENKRQSITEERVEEKDDTTSEDFDCSDDGSCYEEDSGESYITTSDGISDDASADEQPENPKKKRTYISRHRDDYSSDSESLLTASEDDDHPPQPKILRRAIKK